MTDILPIIDNSGPVTPHSLLNKAIGNTLIEYAEYYLLHMKQLYKTLVYIRIEIEPIFITDEKQLVNIYNTIRESVDTHTRRQSGIPIRFLSTVFNRWLSYISDELEYDVTIFIKDQAAMLANVLTLQRNTHTRMDDVLGDTLPYEEWVEWLTDCPLFILIFTMKHIDSSYLVQTQEFVALYDKNKDNPEYVQEA